MKPLGQHLLLDLFDCDTRAISSLQIVKTSMLEAARRACATVVNTVFHEFSPHGVSGVVERGLLNPQDAQNRGLVPPLTRTT